MLTSSFQKVKLMHIYVASLPYKEIRQLNRRGLKIQNLAAPNFMLPYFSYLKKIVYDKLEECALEWLLKRGSKCINTKGKPLWSHFENMDDDDNEEYEPNESESESSEGSFG